MFCSFASNHVVETHIQSNAVLRLSVVIKVVAEQPFRGVPRSTPLSHAIGELFEGCYKQDEARGAFNTPYGTCVDSTRRRNASDTHISGNFSGSLLREADFQNEFLVRTLTNGSNESEYTESGVTHETGTGNESHSASSQSITPTTRLLCPISFQPFIAFKGLYCTSTDDHDSCIIADAPPRSPTGLIASPYIPPIQDGGNSSIDDPKTLSSSSVNHDISDSNQNTITQSLIHGDIQNSSVTDQTRFSNHDYFAVQDRKTLEGNSKDPFLFGKESSPHRGLCLGNMDHDDQINTTCEGSTVFQCHIGPDVCPTASPTGVHFNSRNYNPQLSYDPRVHKMDQLGNLFLPCMKGDSHDLLADSLRTISHQSHVKDTCGTLSKISRSSYINPKQVSLTLPFTDSLKTFQVRRPYVLENEIQSHPNYTYDHNGSSLRDFEMQSNYNTDAEVSPISPPPLTSLTQQFFLPTKGNNIDSDIIPTRKRRDISISPNISSSTIIDPSKCEFRGIAGALIGDCSLTEFLVLPVNDNESCKSKKKLTISRANLKAAKFSLCGRKSVRPSAQCQTRESRTSHGHLNDQPLKFPLDISLKAKTTQEKKDLRQSVAISLLGVLLSQVSQDKLVLVSSFTKHAITMALKSIVVIILLATIFIIEGARTDKKSLKTIIWYDCI